MNRALTLRQQAVYDFIRDKIVNRGYGPTVREIGEHLDIRSPNGVMCHLRALERKEMIRRLANKSRAIELTESINRREPVQLPLAGRVSANICSLNLDTAEQINFEVLFHPQDRFLLQVFGDSLSDQHLVSGDYLIVHSQASAEPGQLVVAKAADGQISLKRWNQEVIYSKPSMENSSQPHASGDVLAIVGVVKGIIREMI